MKNLRLAIIILILLGVVAGGYFLLRNRSNETQIPINSPTNPPGVINPNVESNNYQLWDRDEYEQARAEGKIIMLYFTANWCPICREQEPVNMSTLQDLASDSEIIAFRVHILDSETTDETEALAEEFDVPYQHTTVIIGPSGEIVDKYTGPLSAEDLKQRLLGAKNLQ